MNTPVLDALAKLLTKDRVYVLQHAHCGHIAVRSSHRSSIEMAHGVAFSKGMHAWRVRVLTPGVEKGSCERCEDDMAALAPKKQPRKLAAKKAARARKEAVAADA